MRGAVSAARTTITVKNADITAGQATVSAVVFSELRYQSSEMSPPVLTSEARKHAFQFRSEGDRWLLTEDVPEKFPRLAPTPHWWDRLIEPPRVPESARTTAPVCSRPTVQEP